MKIISKRVYVRVYVITICRELENLAVLSFDGARARPDMRKGATTYAQERDQICVNCLLKRDQICVKARPLMRSTVKKT